jgi:hypothetical protein
VGSGVNHLFRMGGGTGIHISEPVYRQLPNAPRRMAQGSAACDLFVGRAVGGASPQFTWM